MFPAINDDLLQQMAGALAAANGDDADLYLQYGESESVSLEEGMVKHVSASTRQGVGARVIRGEASGLACTDRLEPTALLDCVQAAQAISTSGGNSKPLPLAPISERQTLYSADNPMLTCPIPERRELLEWVDRFTRGLDPRVIQVYASVTASFSDILLVRLDGLRLRDRRPLVRFNVSVVVEQNGRRETGSAGGGGRFDLSRLVANHQAEQFCREAVRLALLNLEAIDAPAGAMPVVLGPGWPGVLLHEAVGHGLEGDFNRRGSSAFSGKMGQRVASPGVTVVDDGTIPERRGSLNFDDEGTPTQRTTLIEDGILVNYLQDKQNARLMKMAPTGNGRRESYADTVLPRMTNTFMLAGNHDPQEIITSLERGIYAVNFGGGQVDITSGHFVFTTSEAYLVEKGKIIAPVKGATLIGDGPAVMQRISMIGNDLKLDPGVGTCGKEGQSVPVGVGMPTVRIEEIIVGGAQ